MVKGGMSYNRGDMNILNLISHCIKKYSSQRVATFREV